jgi:hypothetical protein
MLSWFKLKKMEKKGNEENVITFDLDDDCFARAKKILEFAKVNLESRAWVMAEAIKIYMDLDKKAQEQRKNDKTCYCGKLSCVKCFAS